jgi:hypothetical protein
MSKQRILQKSQRGMKSSRYRREVDNGLFSGEENIFSVKLLRDYIRGVHIPRAKWSAQRAGESRPANNHNAFFLQFTISSAQFYDGIKPS